MGQDYLAVEVFCEGHFTFVGAQGKCNDMRHHFGD